MGPAAQMGRRYVTAPDGYEVRGSVLIIHQHAVLLVHRTDHRRDNWVLPGGTPREGESLAACARRELLEETGISADPSRVALIAESARPESGRRVLDVPFVAPEPVLGMARGREPGLEPHFVPPGQLTGLDLHPSLAGHLQRLADPGPHEHAAYVGNSR